jgi:hypothetical protein
MSDTTASVRVKSENSPAAGHFAMPKIEFPENLREFAEEAMAQTRGNYERIEAAANDLGERASKHAVDCGQKHRELSNLDIVNYRTWMMKVAHGNVIAAFEFAQDMSTAKSLSDVMGLASAHAPDTMLSPPRLRS